MEESPQHHGRHHQGQQLTGGQVLVDPQRRQCGHHTGNGNTHGSCGAGHLGRGAAKQGRKEPHHHSSIEAIDGAAFPQCGIAEGQSQRQGHHGSGDSPEQISTKISQMKAMGSQKFQVGHGLRWQRAKRTVGAGIINKTVMSLPRNQVTTDPTTGPYFSKVAVIHCPGTTDPKGKPW